MGATIGVVAESLPAESRVAATPTTVTHLIGLGYRVHVESDAGIKAGFADDAYATAGATVVSTSEAWAREIVLKVNAPTDDEIDRLRPGAILVGLLGPAHDAHLVDKLADRQITALAIDAAPHISPAPSKNALSSVADLTGYHAVIEAAREFGRFFTGQLTAAATASPVKVLVVGSGTAGLAAIGAASSLGAIVRATDPRPDAAQQVRALGGEYLPVVADEGPTPCTDGSARNTSDAYSRRAAEIYSQQAREVDLIITTALVPGRPAPRLITAADVASMKSGSIIVDMATAHGGNVEGSIADQVVRTANGVTILGYTDLAGRSPAQASQLYATNLVHLAELVTPNKDGQWTLDLDDIVQRGITVARDGERLWPATPVQAGTVPPPEPTAPAPTGSPSSTGVALRLVAVGIAVLFLLVAYTPDPIAQHFTLLVLAIVTSYHVIGRMYHRERTPRSR
ncbi:Re/Si-specific NAD(P)(+) transhydrogenase subunit alpha [Rhodococcus indonesiensis]|uniref:Re/Si-specific NAD(P)(+) transhydrogenase subunit alpha n=1 Tax=Rhodococcus indonesiensis TaxID=3055869 RepID=UPI0039F6CC8C